MRLRTVSPDKTLACLLTEHDTDTQLTIAFRFYLLAVAFHVALPKNTPENEALEFEIPIKLYEDVRCLAAARIRETVYGGRSSPDVSSNTEPMVALALYELSGGDKRLRHAMSVSAVEKKLVRARKQMRHVGKALSIQLRSLYEGGELIGRTKLLELCGDEEFRDAFDLRYARTKTSQFRDRLEPILPFAHLVYVTHRKRSAMGRLSKLKGSNFVASIRKRAEDPNQILRFISEYNETALQLRKVGYECLSLKVPSGVELPPANITHEPWPRSLVD